MGTCRWSRHTHLIDILKKSCILFHTDVLKISVRLSRVENSELFRATRHIVQRQPALSDEVVKKLRALLGNDKYELVAVLQERLQLPDKAFKWLETHITKEKDANIKYDEAINYLLSQSHFPNNLMTSLPELKEMGIDFMPVAEALRHKRTSQVTTWLFAYLNSALLEFPLSCQNSFKNHISANPFPRTLQQTRSETEAGTGHSIGID